jgi:hypothetical protein
MATTEEQTIAATNALELFKTIIGVFFPGEQNQPWMSSLYEAAKSQIEYGVDPSAIADILIQTNKTPKEFNDRFAGIIALRDKFAAGQNVYVPSIAEYVAGEKAYANLVTAMGMNDLASRQNYATLVGNDVSLDEVRARIDEAYNRVKSLDASVREQLKASFPNLTDTSMAQAILTGQQGIDELKRRIGVSEIQVEANQAGFQSLLGATALQAAGVTREQARQGFQQVGAAMNVAGQGYLGAAQAFGESMTTNELQTELEKEALLGQVSTKRRRLASQARGQMSGTSGIQTGSLSRRTSGMV